MPTRRKPDPARNAFISEYGLDVPAKSIVKEAAEAGLDITPMHVHAWRHAYKKRQAKLAKAVPANKKPNGTRKAFFLRNQVKLQEQAPMSLPLTRTSPDAEVDNAFLRAVIRIGTARARQLLDQIDQS